MWETLKECESLLRVQEILVKCKMSRENPLDKDLNQNVDYLNGVNASAYSPQQHQAFTNAVISVLQGPDQATMVSKQYSNDRNLATEVQAYAKISGTDWTYYVKGLEISIGRNTDTAVHVPNVDVKDGLNTIDIDLGPAKVVSRKHAVIKFNMQHGGWELLVLGRNGAKVNFKRVPVGPAAPPVLLTSGTILDIGGTQMMFILPEQEPLVSQACINHLIPKLVARYGTAVNSGYRSNDINALLYDILKESDYLKRQPPQQPQQQQIRTFKMYGNGTSNHGEFGPAMQLNADAQFVGGPSNINNGGVMLTPGTSNGQAVHNDLNLSYTGPNPSLSQIGFPQSLDFASDLSRDENKNVKPPHSYATMITQAILSTREGVISLADIYKYISSNYAYYRFAKSGWQNSIRHNLSLNKAFEKVPRRPNEPGKGMKWRISEEYQRDFLSKWNAGKIGKVRRGSSVARQLQLHLSKYNSLPSQSDYTPEQAVIKLQNMHNRTRANNQSNPQSQPQSQVDSSSIPVSPADAVSAPPSQNLMPSDQQRQPSQQLQPTRLMPPPTSGPRVDQNPTNNALVSFTNASNSTASTVPSSGSYSIPPRNVPPIITDSSASHLSPSHSSILRSPTKAFHITAMEAYTPERGSAQQSRSPVASQNNDANLLTVENSGEKAKKSSQNDEAQDITNGATGEKLTNRSSPGVWNLLQFSSVNNTPAVMSNNERKNSSTEGSAKSGLNHEVPGDLDTKDVASSPLKRQQNQQGGKELMLDTEGAKITIANE